MSNILKRKKNIRIMYSKPILLFLIILLFVMGRAVWNVYEKEKESRKNLALVQKEYNELTEKEANLIEKNEDLKTHKGIERELRDRFGVAKEGEEMILIFDNEEDSGNIIKEKRSLWKKIIEWFR